MRKNFIVLFISIVNIYFMGSSYAACGLAFLPGNTSGINIDGNISGGEWDDASVVTSGDPCLEDLLEILDESHLFSDTLWPHRTAVFRTIRDEDNFYIAIEVDDQTYTTSDIGENIVLHMDPANNRMSSPQNDDRRLVIKIIRTAASAPEPASFTKKWYEGNGTQWNLQSTLPASIDIDINNGPLITDEVTGESVYDGYKVEIKIPFTAINYTKVDDKHHDFSFAVAVIDDMDIQDAVSNEILSGITFPASFSLKPNGLGNDPLDVIDLDSQWNNPEHWGEAYTTGAGDTIYMSDEPGFYVSKDIVTAFCNASSFEDAGTRGSSNPRWYKYKKTDPCKLRFWGKVRRKGALVGAEQRRVLFLWGEHGINGREWNYVHLTDPITIDPESPNPATDESFPAIYEITPGAEWSRMTPGLDGHPCLRAFILPGQLKPGDEELFKGISADGTSNWDMIQTEVIDDYGLDLQHQAQSNIYVVDDVVCPDSEEDGCVSLTSNNGQENPIRVASLDIKNLNLTHLIKTNQTTSIPKKDDVPAHMPRLTDAIYNIEAYGVVVGDGLEKKYTYLERLGGVQHVINLKYLQKHDEIDIPVKVTNADDYDRRIYYKVAELTRNDITKVKVSLDGSGGVFKAGETKIIKSEVNRMGAFEYWLYSFCGKFTKQDSIALIGGVGLIGFVTWRRKRKIIRTRKQ